MKFGYTIIYVQNVEQTLEFYQKAFSCKLRMVSESKLYGEFDTGGTKLAFCDESFCQKSGLDFAPNRASTRSAGFEIGFLATDVQASYDQAIAHGAQSLQAPTQKPWGQIVAYVKDCNGVIVEICNEVEY